MHQAFCFAFFVAFMKLFSITVHKYSRSVDEHYLYVRFTELK